MQFSKWNNPNKKRRRKRIDRTTADIIAGKRYIDDAAKGTAQPIEFYDHISDKMCGEPSRRIY